MRYLTQMAGWQSLLSSTSRKVGIGVTVVAVSCCLAGVILWDADFYAVRDRWENFKIAMFGPWGKGRKAGASDSCEQVRSFENAFKDIVDFNFFQRVPIDGTTLNIITGTSYPSSSDVLAGRADTRWCYISVGTGNVGTRIELGWQAGNAPPVFLPLQTLSPSFFAKSGMDAVRLGAVARTHCRFVQKAGRASPPPPDRRPA